MPLSAHVHAARMIGLFAAVGIGLSACGPGPDMPTACANRVADMFGVPREKVGLGDVFQEDDGTFGIGGAVDLKFWSDGTRAFGCHFDKDGRLTVKIEVSDAE